jgi:hypothetical protein
MKNACTRVWFLIHSFAVLTTLWASCALAGGPSPSIPQVLGLTIGRAHIRDALFLNGPATASLAGHDRESSQPTRSDPVVLRYEGSFRLATEHAASVRLYFDPESQVLAAASVSFEHQGAVLPELSEVTDTFGPAHRVVHRRWAFDSGGIEGTLGECDDPLGEVESWLFPAAGLEVFVDSKLSVLSSLRFAESLTAEGVYPPCGGGN